MKNFEKAWIQQNNNRWINPKVMEGVNRYKPAPAPKPMMEFMSGSYFDTRMGRKSSVTPFSITQALYSAEGSVANELPTPSECYSCKNYSHSPYLKCAVNPARTIDQECDKFEM